MVVSLVLQLVSVPVYLVRKVPWIASKRALRLSPCSVQQVLIKVGACTNSTCCRDSVWTLSSPASTGLTTCRGLEAEETAAHRWPAEEQDEHQR